MSGSNPRSDSASVVHRSGPGRFVTTMILEDLSGAREAFVWVPNALGSIGFLVASYFAYAEVCLRWVGWQPANVSWWVVWRSHDELPQDLIFHVNYLGGDVPTFTLNFSRPGNQIVAQYYNFIRLGRDGYTRVLEQIRDTAVYLSSEIDKLGVFQLLTRGDTIPPNVQELAVLRIVVREGFSRDLADILLAHLRAALEHFESQPSHASIKPDTPDKVHKNC